MILQKGGLLLCTQPDNPHTLCFPPKNCQMWSLSIELGVSKPWAPLGLPSTPHPPKKELKELSQVGFQQQQISFFSPHQIRLFDIDLVWGNIPLSSIFEFNWYWWLTIFMSVGYWYIIIKEVSIFSLCFKGSSMFLFLNFESVLYILDICFWGMMFKYFYQSDIFLY